MVEHWLVVPATRVQFPLATPIKHNANFSVVFLLTIDNMVNI